MNTIKACNNFPKHKYKQSHEGTGNQAHIDCENMK